MFNIVKTCLEELEKYVPYDYAQVPFEDTDIVKGVNDDYLLHTVNYRHYGDMLRIINDAVTQLSAIGADFSVFINGRKGYNSIKLTTTEYCKNGTIYKDDDIDEEGFPEWDEEIITTITIINNDD